MREWVDGILGDEWTQQWIEGGCDMDDEALIFLFNLFNSLAKRGIYLLNLKSENMLWNGSEWIVIDYGGTRTDLKFEEAKRV